MILKTIELYRRWWGTWHTLPVRSWLRAAAYYRNGRFQEAARLYRLGLEKHSKHPAAMCARLDLAYSLFRLGQLREAESELRYAANYSPESRDAQIRLAQFQLWRGQALEAAWTMRRALHRLSPDAELAALYLNAVIENGGPGYLLKEAVETADRVEHGEEHAMHKLYVARARLLILEGRQREAYEELSKLANAEDSSVEALSAFAELLINEGKVAYARQYLRRGLVLVPNHPRLLSLFAESYLVSGPLYCPEYAVQMATNACQSSQWSSPRDIHILAEAYHHAGDRMGALLMASKAKEEGTRLMGAYRDVKSLDKLIETLSSGTLS